MKKIIFWSDHWWFALKNELIRRFENEGFEIEDVWAFNEDSVDYPDIAKLVASKVLDSWTPWVLLCWTWIWISIAANKVKWIRAANVHNLYEAAMAKRHNNANIICLWWRTIWPEIAKLAIHKYLKEEFEGWRHEKRVNKSEAI